jgi:cytochrome c553
MQFRPLVRKFRSCKGTAAFGALATAKMPNLHSHLAGIASISAVLSPRPIGLGMLRVDRGPHRRSRINARPIFIDTHGVTEMTRRLTAIIIIASFGVVGAVQAAGNAAAGKDKSAVCAGCHGDKGQGTGQGPALAGKPEADLVKALKDFKSVSTNSVMHGLAATLSGQDIENLAAYYASLK